MEEQIGRIYYEIIDEVCTKLSEEGSLYDIDRSLIYSIQNEWIKNLETVQNEPKREITPREPKREDTLIFSDEEYEEDDINDYIQDEQINNIEQEIDNYMVCLFVKVAKTKGKWKCNFKQGFINVDKTDIPFSNAIGELEW